VGERMKWVSIYERDEELYIQQSLQIGRWMWKNAGPIATVRREDGPAVVGQVVLSVFSWTIESQDVPDEKAVAPLLRAAGVRTWAAFGKTAEALRVIFGDQLILEPYRRSGKHGGFERTDQQLTLRRDAAPNELGSAILESLAAQRED